MPRIYASMVGSVLFVIALAVLILGVVLIFVASSPWLYLVAVGAVIAMLLINNRFAERGSRDPHQQNP